MKWWCVMALVFAGCRVGDLVQTPPAAGQLRFSVQPSHADSGEMIEPPVQVTVLDAAVQPDTTYPHTVTVFLIQNPGGAALSGSTVASVVRGVATFANLRLDRPGTGYVLRASASARPPAMSATFDVTREPAKRLAFTVQPGTTASGITMAPAVRVSAHDSAGNLLATHAGSITVVLGGNPAGVLSGGMTQPMNSGIATFATLRIEGAGTYTLTATGSGIGPAVSLTFTVTPPAASQLVFTTQPSNARVNRKIEPPVQVLVLDASGRPLTTFTGAVTIDLAPNLFSARVTGTATANAVYGVATFDNLRVDRVGIAYQLRAAFSGQGPIAQSAPFTVGL